LTIVKFADSSLDLGNEAKALDYVFDRGIVRKALNCLQGSLFVGHAVTYLRGGLQGFYEEGAGQTSAPSLVGLTLFSAAGRAGAGLACCQDRLWSGPLCGQRHHPCHQQA